MTEETRNLIDINRLKRMKKTAYFISTCEPEIIVEKDLVQALKEGIIAGAALDEIQKKTDNPLFEMDNVVLTPHSAFATWETRWRCRDTAIANAEAFIKEKRFWT